MTQEQDTNPESLGSRGARRYESRAREYLADPAKTKSLLEDAQNKAGRGRLLGGAWDDFVILCRMVKAYAEGSYRETPWVAIVSATAAILYFVIPADLIPDLIAGLGLLDDAAVLAWTLAAVRTSLEAFRDWEERQQQRPPTPPTSPS